MKLWILSSVLLDDGYLCDTGDDATQFLGAHSSLAHARKFATQVAEADRKTANAEQLEDGEAEFPPVQLTWTKGTETHMVDGKPVRRETWQSDRVEYCIPVYFEITESRLDPELT